MSDSESSSDEMIDMRSAGRAPSGPPKPPSASSSASSSMPRPTLIDDDSDSSSSSEDTAAAERAAALARYREEEEAQEAAIKAKQDQRAKEIAAEAIDKAAEIPDDNDDSDMEEPRAKGSASGSAPVVRPGASAPSDLQATMKDKKFKEKVKANSARYNVGYAETIGKRPTMEDKLVILGSLGGDKDRDYFAVFDGHGGAESAAFANKHLHKHVLKELEERGATGGDDPKKVGEACHAAFAKCQEAIEKEEIEAGTTAIVVLVLGDRMFVANLGDCRAVLVRRDGSGERASYDHKPSDPKEEERVIKAGGFVTKSVTKGVVTARVNGMLAVARSLGDNSLRQYLTAEPQMHGPFNVKEYAGLVLACDGVWDVVSDNTAARLALAEFKKSDPEQAAIQVRNKAWTRKTKDNVSVVCVQFE